MWIASQRVQADRTLNLAMASMTLDDAIRRSVEADASTVVEKTALDGFLEICRALDVMEIYSWWALESNFIHPRSLTQNAFLDIMPDAITLRHEPQLAAAEPRDVVQSLALILLWAALAEERMKSEPAQLQVVLDTYRMVGREPLPRIVYRPACYGKRKPRTKGWTAQRSTPMSDFR